MINSDELAVCLVSNRLRHKPPYTFVVPALD